MASRLPLLAFLAAATTIAACHADPLSPLSGSTILRDEGDPECVDTIYVDSAGASMARAGAPIALDATTEEEAEQCHVVVIWE